VSDRSGNPSNRHDPSTACWQQQMPLRAQTRTDMRDRCAGSADHVRNGLSRGHCLVLEVCREVSPGAKVMCNSPGPVKRISRFQGDFFCGTLWVPKFAKLSRHHGQAEGRRKISSAKSANARRVRTRLNRPRHVGSSGLPGPARMRGEPDSAHLFLGFNRFRTCRCHGPFRPGSVRRRPNVRRSCRWRRAKGRRRPMALHP